MEWIDTKYNDFFGIQKDTRKAQLGSFEILQNLDLRGKSGDLELRNGYDIKYDKISDTTLSDKKLSNVQYLKATNFWIDDNGGQEITVQILKHRVTAQTTLSPNYLDMLGVWIRPFWDGSSWVDEWHWLNEVIITKITAVNGGTDNDIISLYLQLNGTDKLKNWSILHYTGSNYDSPNEVSSIFYSNDNSYQEIKIHASDNNWSVDDKVLLMRNYFPPETLNDLYNDITADEIVFHNVLDDLRIGFGGKSNRLGMSIGYRKRYLSVSKNDNDAATYNRTLSQEERLNDSIYLDPYNAINDYDDTFTLELTTSQNTSTSFPVGRAFFKIVAVVDGYQRFLVGNVDSVVTAINDDILVTTKTLLGPSNKRITSLEIYLGADFTLSGVLEPYQYDTSNYQWFLVTTVTLSSIGTSLVGSPYVNGAGQMVHANSTPITYADFQDASEEISDVLGYSLPADYLRGWDHVAVINGRTYLLNGYSDQRYENKIFYSELSGSSANMPDVLANSYHDVENFDGDNAIGIKKTPNNYLGVWSENKFQLLNAYNGIPLGLGTIYKGAISKESIVNLGQELIWGTELDITHNKGYRITDVSEGSVRGGYREISDKSKIIAIREESGNSYRFFDGNSTEYILTPRGWQIQILYIKPTNYLVRKNGDVWYMSDGVIYYPKDYKDRKDINDYVGIPFVAKSMPIDIGLLDKGITNTNRLYLHAFHIECTTTPPETELKIFLDGELYSTKKVEGQTNIFFRIPQGGVCKQFQFEFTGEASETFVIKSMGPIWKPKVIGVIHGRSY